MAYQQEPRGPVGPWQNRVVFATGGGFAYRPGQLVVRIEDAELAAAVLRRTAGDSVRGESILGERFVRFSFDGDPLRAIAALHRAGVRAQVNHVLFATSCCPPHPADPAAAPFYASFDASTIDANPFYASPFYASPFYASAGGCCGCCGGAGANPFYASPFYASPFYASADPNPVANPAVQTTGRRSSSARPADPPGAETCATDAAKVRIAILDTGHASEKHAPTGLSFDLGGDLDDVPDEDGDAFLDPAAGHGTFIAGVIEQLTPGCALEQIAVLSTYGDGDEVEISTALDALARRPVEERPHIVNLSFGGYTPMGMEVLAAAITQLNAAGIAVVASAGNDGTCAPMFPAALPGVVGVAALHADEKRSAAEFTNYGPWVRACTIGVDVVSTFFDHFNGREGVDATGVDIDEFAGWAVWSGTSFAAPRVAAALAAEVAKDVAPLDAVSKLVDDPTLDRRPMLGTVVLP